MHQTVHSVKRDIVAVLRGFVANGESSMRLTGAGRPDKDEVL